MRFKLDENVPRHASASLERAGHDTVSVLQEGLGGAPDAVVAAAASAEGRVFVTLDRGLGDVRSRPPGTHPGIVVLRLDDQSARNVSARLAGFVAQVDLGSIEGCITIVEEDRVRIRRPNPSGP